MDLQADGLSVYYGNALALYDISIKVNSGEITSIIGPNGAGKTTFLNTVAGLLRQRKGKIKFSGEDVSKLTTAERVKRGIVLCPERRRLFPGLTVLENIKLGAYLRKDDIKGDLDLVYSLFPILKERKDQQAGTLSGGEQQMVAIARSIMSSPRLLMLDEPSLGLSPIMRERIFSAISELNKERKMTILLVEQDAADALSISRHTYVLESGRVVMQGSSSEMLLDENVRKSYLGI